MQVEPWYLNWPLWCPEGHRRWMLSVASGQPFRGERIQGLKSAIHPVPAGWAGIKVTPITHSASANLRPRGKEGDGLTSASLQRA